MGAMPFSIARRAAALGLLALAVSAAAQGTTQVPAPSTAAPGTAVPTGAAAAAAVELSSAIGGRVINCPSGLRISDQAVCLFASGTVDGFKPRVKARLGERVIEDWKTRAGSKNASLLFKSGEDITYVLLAQANSGSVLAVIDAPASSVAGSTSTKIAFVAASDLKSLLTVQAADTVGTFTRLGQSAVVTAGNRAARLNGTSLQLPGAPYAQGGQLYVPVVMLRNLGCTVAEPVGNKVSVTCGAKTATLNAVGR